jgi:uridylate kinase
MNSMKVISLGGSLVSPNGVDVTFLSHFKRVVLQWLEAGSNRKIILVTGGGAPARLYQEAGRTLVPQITNDDLDWLGIAATKLNAQLVKRLFGLLCVEEVVDNPSIATFNQGRILVGAGWKPGFSSDYDAAFLAHRFGATQIINLSNIDHVYSSDPKKNSSAKPLEKISWHDLQTLVGDVWTPGSNLPFDPIAAKFAREHNLTVVVASGANLPNIKAILDDESFVGTIIH